MLPFIPGEKFISISITGPWCGLKCSFCSGRYLSAMVFAETPGKLRDVLLYYHRRGSVGFLISGGFNPEGYLPISSEHIKVLEEFRRGREVYLSVHLGLAPRELVDEALGVFDSLDHEIPPSSEFVKRGRGLKATVDDYLRVLEYVTQEYGEDRVSPHVILGSTLATREDELEALRRLSETHDRIVVLLLDLSAGGSYESERLLEGFRLAKQLFKEVSLGCMRPRWLDGLVMELVELEYVDRVAIPGRRLLEKLGAPAVNSCCSIPRSKLELFAQGPRA